MTLAGLIDHNNTYRNVARVEFVGLKARPHDPRNSTAGRRGRHALLTSSCDEGLEESLTEVAPSRELDESIPEPPPSTIQACLWGHHGVPTNVVTLCAVSVTVTREFDTVTGESWPRLLAADVSYGVSEQGALLEM